MFFLLTSQILNGVTTIGTETVIVEAPDFSAAKDKVKSIMITAENVEKHQSKICQDDDYRLVIQSTEVEIQENSSWTPPIQFTVMSVMKSAEARII